MHGSDRAPCGPARLWEPTSLDSRDPWDAIRTLLADASREAEKPVPSTARAHAAWQWAKARTPLAAGCPLPATALGALTRVASAIVLMASTASPAIAQIYTWRDTNGNLVLSDRPRDGVAVRTYGVPKAEHLRVTRPAPSSRARLYESLIDEYAKLHNVRPALVHAVVQVESAFNPAAVSPKGAMGLMQLMPATARMLKVGNPFDPTENVRGGVAYLRQLLDRYDGNEELALAAYNAGPGAVDRHGQSIPPYAETQSYVSKVSDIAGDAPPPKSGTKIYRVTELVDGREIVRYTDRKPGL